MVDDASEFSLSLYKKFLLRKSISGLFSRFYAVMDFLHFILLGFCVLHYVELSFGKSDIITTEAIEISSTGQVHNDCDSVTIKCVCGIGNNRKNLFLDLKMYAIQDPITNKTKCSGFPDPYQTCASHACTFTTNGTQETKLGSAGKKFNSFIQSFYPQEFTIPKGGEGHRYTRQGEPCHVTPLKNAEIKCWKWPNWINCDINCIHGYALQTQKETVKNTNINCRLTENVWKNHGFIDCQPFINCKVHLVKPGELRCKEPISSPAFCEISCLDYDDHEATSLQKYECLDDSFAQILPHCAVLGEKVQLVRKPK